MLSGRYLGESASAHARATVSRSGICFSHDGLYPVCPAGLELKGDQAVVDLAVLELVGRPLQGLVQGCEDPGLCFGVEVGSLDDSEPGGVLDRGECLLCVGFVGVERQVGGDEGRGRGAGEWPR